MLDSSNLYQIKSQLHELLPLLKQKYPIEKLALFGSVTREDFDPEKSDIEIMVEFNGSIGWDYFDLYFDLQKLFPGKKVDLVSRGGIQPHYWDYLKNKMIYV